MKWGGPIRCSPRCGCGTQVTGRSGLLLHVMFLASVGSSWLAGGCALQLCWVSIPQSSSSPFPPWVHRHLPFLQLGPQPGAVETPPAIGPLSQSHLPWDEPVCCPPSSPLLAVTSHLSLQVVSADGPCRVKAWRPPGKTESEEQNLGGATVSSAYGASLTRGCEGDADWAPALLSR